jgi:tetratricopeptide (TPR) repeat protein
MTENLQMSADMTPDVNDNEPFGFNDTETSADEPTDTAPTVEDVITVGKPRITFLDWVRGLFGYDVRQEAQQRLANLNAAIVQHPEGYANYLQRADLYMEIRRYADALDDYQKAYELANAEFEQSAWGVLAGSVRERAAKGIERVVR